MANKYLIMSHKIFYRPDWFPTEELAKLFMALVPLGVNPQALTKRQYLVYLPDRYAQLVQEAIDQGENLEYQVKEYLGMYLYGKSATEIAEELMKTPGYYSRVDQFMTDQPDPEFDPDYLITEEEAKQAYEEMSFVELLTYLVF